VANLDDSTTTGDEDQPLYAAGRGGSADAEINELFEGLKKYVQLHFTTEERLLKGIGYDELDAHVAQHRRLAEEAKALEARWRSGGRGVGMEVLAFLKDWLVNHIQKVDKRYSQAFARAGISDAPRGGMKRDPRGLRLRGFFSPVRRRLLAQAHAVGDVVPDPAGSTIRWVHGHAET
jgi:hemerythrin-like metal-binding protein